MRLLLTIALVASLGLVAAPRAQGGLDGDWTLTFDTPMGSMDASATFTTEGETLTGTMSSEVGTTSFQGTLKGNALAWVMSVYTPQGSIDIQMNGELEGDTLKGTFDFGQGAGSWTGKRVH